MGIIECMLMCGLVAQALGHGRLMDPVGRSSAWRLGYNVPKNYDDNALFCGGFAAQQNNGGRCGVCGDPYNGRRDNEPPHGKYATGTIVKTYKEGSIITTKAEITANHNGWMEYRICPNNDVTTPVTQDCLDRYVLQRADGKGSKVMIPPHETGMFKMEYKLPDGMTCSQCVIQWKYHAGNSWGTDPATGRSCNGCGAQEEFYGCADVAIEPRSGSGSLPIVTAPPVTQTPRTTRPPVIYTNPPAATTKKPTRSLSGCHAINIWDGDADMDQWCVENCAIDNCPPLGCECGDPAVTNPPTPVPTTPKPTTTPRPTTPPTTATRRTTRTTTTPAPTPPPTTTIAGPTEYISKVVCKAINLWAGNEYLDRWCADACARGNCPDDSCKCSLTQVAVTKLTTPAPGVPLTDKPATQPTTTVVQTMLVCKAIDVWAGIDVFDAWCNEECAKGNCPAETCSCTGSPMFPLNKTTMPPTQAPTTKTTTTTTTTTTAAPTTKQTTQPANGKTNTCVSNGIVGGDYWDDWCQRNCDRDMCAVDYCFCS